MHKIGPFMLAPFPAAVLGSALSFATGGFPRPTALLLAYLLAFYAAQILFGIPIRLMLRRQGRTSAASFVLAGVMMIALPAIPYLAWATAQTKLHALAIIVLLLWLSCGGIIGLSYWWLVRPDKARRDEPA